MYMYCVPCMDFTTISMIVYGAKVHVYTNKLYMHAYTESRNHLKTCDLNAQQGGVQEEVHPPPALNQHEAEGNCKLLNFRQLLQH